MSDFIIRNASGDRISCVEDWRQLAPPKERDKHWKPGRSAMEEARAWFPGPAVPAELLELLAQEEMTRSIVPETVVPEYVTKLDGFRGGQRNHDVMIEGRAAAGKAVVCIEAKADEPFDRVAGAHATSAVQRTPSSKLPARLQLMCNGLFGGRTAETDALRYQLLTGAAGTFVEATRRKADIAVFVIHEFTGFTAEANLRRNAADLNAFVRLLSGQEDESLDPGQLLGPISVPGNAFFSGDIPFFVGKCRRDVRPEPTAR